MELIEKLKQMKTILVTKNLDSCVDTINETIEYLNAMPGAVAPTADDFFPSEPESRAPIIIYGGNFYFGDKISKQIIDSIFENENGNFVSEDDPPLVEQKN